MARTALTDVAIVLHPQDDVAISKKEIKAGKSREEIQKLENLPGFADFHVPPGRGNRLPGNLGVAYDELTSG